jgi:hypothetical protein
VYHLHCTVTKIMSFFTFFSLPRKKSHNIHTKVYADYFGIVLFLQLISQRIFSSSRIHYSPEQIIAMLAQTQAKHPLCGFLRGI